MRAASASGVMARRNDATESGPFLSLAGAIENHLLGVLSDDQQRRAMKLQLFASGGSAVGSLQQAQLREQHLHLRVVDEADVIGVFANQLPISGARR